MTWIPVRSLFPGLICKACGRQAYGLPHNIRHRVSRVGNETSNPLRLCADCHYGIVHGPAGIKGLIEPFLHLRENILKIKPALAFIIAINM